jgi:UDP-glucose 4-epimerase
MTECTEYEGKTILVTGGAGCIGSALCRRLSELKAQKIIILDNLSSSCEWTVPVEVNIKFLRGDILDDGILYGVFAEKPEYVFHLAAHSGNQNSVDHPERDLMVNGLGILMMLRKAYQCGVKRFVYSSAGNGVYGLESSLPFKEEDVSIRLQTPYQVTKLLGELYTNCYHYLYQVPIVNARFSDVFGPGEVPGRYRSVIPNFFYWGMNNQQLPIPGDGSETRDWTYVDDIVTGLLQMGICEEAVGEAINLGSGLEISMLEMAKMVNRLTGNNAGVNFTKPREWEVQKRVVLSIEKAQKLLGYQPRTSFTEGLRHVNRWFKENWTAIEESVEFPNERVLV